MNSQAMEHLPVQLFGWVLKASWQGSVLLLLILLVQWLARRRLPANWRYNLWLLLVVRLLLPFSPESAASLFNAVKWHPAAPVLESPVSETPKAALPPAVVDPAPALSNSPITEIHHLPLPTPPSDAHEAQEVSPVIAEPVIAQRPHIAAHAWRLPTAIKIGAWLWLTGVLALSVRIVAALRHVNRRLAEARPVIDTAALGILESSRQCLRLRQKVALLESDLVKSPALFGVWRPRLLLPPGLIHDFSPEELRYVFLHELAHVRRRDLLLNWLLALAQTLHWFNPLLWPAFARLRSDRELACDSLAVACAPTEAKAYGLTIVKLLETFQHPSQLPGMVGILEDKHQMQRRIRMIAAFQKSRRWSILAFFLLGALAVIGLTDAVRTSAVPAVSAEPKAPAAPREKVILTVVDGETEKPVAGAPVIEGYITNARYSVPPVPLVTDQLGQVQLDKEALAAGVGFAVVSPAYAPAAVTWNWARSQSQTTKPEIPPAYTIKLHPGVAAGGLVCDEAGRPLANVRVLMKASTMPQRDTEETTGLEYPIYDTLICAAPVTDAQGRWVCPNFPAHVEYLQLDFLLPDNSSFRCHTAPPPWFAASGGELVQMTDIVKGHAKFTFHPGVTVRGIVLNAAGQPFPGIRVVELDNRRDGSVVSESVTKDDGRFVLPNRDPHQILLTFTGPGCALNTAVTDIEPEMAELRVSMSPAKPLRLRVMDENGKPIPNAQISPEMFILKWRAVTDAEGRITWPEAPAEPLRLTIMAEGHGALAKSFTPTDAEQTVTLPKGQLPGSDLTLKVTTSAGQPVDRFTVSVCHGPPRPEDFKPLGEGRDGSFTSFAPNILDYENQYFVRIEALDFEPFVSNAIHAELDRSELTITLRKADPIDITVALPDGSPAAGAKIGIGQAAANQRMKYDLWPKSRVPILDRSNVNELKTNEAGRFSLAGPSDTAVEIVHERGIFETTLGRLRESSGTVQLAAWGKAECIVTFNGKPQEHMRFWLTRRDSASTASFQEADETDAQGHLTIAALPAGSYWISCGDSGTSEMPVTGVQIVNIVAGETARIDFAVIGRPVFGRLLPDPSDADVDWDKIEGTRLLVLAWERREPPAYDNFVVPRSYHDAFEKWEHTNGPPSPSYAIHFDSDGVFRAPAIPPGTYNLKVTLENRKQQEMGALMQKVVIPPVTGSEGDSPLDLGAFPIQIKDAERKPLALFSPKKADGSSLDLSAYRGKTVLLVFSAPWAPFSTAQLAQLTALYTAHGTDPHFVMVQVDLLDASKPAKPSDEFPWLQTFLEGREKTVVTDRLKIESLPAVFTIAPRGFVDHRDFELPKLESAVTHLLEQSR